MDDSAISHYPKKVTILVEDGAAKGLAVVDGGLLIGDRCVDYIEDTMRAYRALLHEKWPLDADTEWAPEVILFDEQNNTLKLEEKNFTLPPNNDIRTLQNVDVALPITAQKKVIEENEEWRAANGTLVQEALLIGANSSYEALLELGADPNLHSSNLFAKLATGIEDCTIPHEHALAIMHSGINLRAPLELFNHDGGTMKTGIISFIQERLDDADYTETFKPTKTIRDALNEIAKYGWNKEKSFIDSGNTPTREDILLMSANGNTLNSILSPQFWESDVREGLEMLDSLPPLIRIPQLPQWEAVRERIQTTNAPQEPRWNVAAPNTHEQGTVGLAAGREK